MATAAVVAAQRSNAGPRATISALPPGLQRLADAHKKEVLAHLNDAEGEGSEAVSDTSEPPAEGESSKIMVQMRDRHLEGMMKMTTESIVETAGVPESMVLKWIEKELGDEKGCMSLPAALVCFFTFCIALQAHWAQQYRFDVQSAIKA